MIQNINALKINDVTQLYLGVQGENGSRTIRISVAEWLVGHPNGSFSIWMKKPGDEEAGPTGASFDAQKKILQWSPSGAETSVAGEGTAEIRMTEGTVIKKTKTVRIGISEAVTGGGETLGSDWQSYIDEVDRIKSLAQAAENAAEASASDAEAYAVGTRGGVPVGDQDPAWENNSKYYAEAAEESHQETVDDGAELLADMQETGEELLADMKDSGDKLIIKAEQTVSKYPYADKQTMTWWVWNTLEKRWVNTGVSARGLKGDRGPAGPQGAEGRQGKPGKDGRNAVVIEIGAVEYSFQIDGQGHLLLYYGGGEAPDFYIDRETGHLMYRI